MPPTFVNHLIEQIAQWEQAGQWPTQLCTGFVHPLPKKADAFKVGDFRPIIIYLLYHLQILGIAARKGYSTPPGSICGWASIWFLAYL